MTTKYSDPGMWVITVGNSVTSTTAKLIRKEQHSGTATTTERSIPKEGTLNRYTSEHGPPVRREG